MLRRSLFVSCTSWLLLAACSRAPVTVDASDVTTPDSAPRADAATGTDTPEEPVAAESDSAFRVHEWGTFTSRLDAAGEMALWTNDQIVEPLPAFVQQNWITPQKQRISGTVRMETPVLYFYRDEAGPVSVHVEFPGGDLTEWYPQAELGTTDEGATLDWPVVEIVPGPDLDYPVAGESHYYAARNTDSAPLQVRAGSQVQTEKLLFYRGVGSFDHPVGATFDKRSVKLVASRPSPAAFLVRRKGKQLGFHALGEIDGEREVALPSGGGSVEELRLAMQDALVTQGLFEREAAAMLDTWQSLWFEDGVRLLYLVPREFTDSILPVHLDPAPDELTRVFVGRLELELE